MRDRPSGGPIETKEEKQNKAGTPKPKVFHSIRTQKRGAGQNGRTKEVRDVTLLAPFPFSLHHPPTFSSHLLFPSSSNQLSLPLPNNKEEALPFLPKHHILTNKQKQKQTNKTKTCVCVCVGKKGSRRNLQRSQSTHLQTAQQDQRREACLSG